MFRMWGKAAPSQRVPTSNCHIIYKLATRRPLSLAHQACWSARICHKLYQNTLIQSLHLQLWPQLGSTSVSGPNQWEQWDVSSVHPSTTNDDVFARLRPVPTALSCEISPDLRRKTAKYKLKDLVESHDTKMAPPSCVAWNAQVQENSPHPYCAFYVKRCLRKTASRCQQVEKLLSDRLSDNPPQDPLQRRGWQRAVASCSKIASNWDWCVCVCARRVHSKGRESDWFVRLRLMWEGV